MLKIFFKFYCFFLHEVAGDLYSVLLQFLIVLFLVLDSFALASKSFAISRFVFFRLFYLG